VKHILVIVISLMTVSCERLQQEAGIPEGCRPVKTILFVHLEQGGQYTIEVWGVDKPIETNGPFTTIEGYLTVVTTATHRECFGEGQPIRNLPLSRHTYPSTSIIRIEEGL